MTLKPDVTLCGEQLPDGAYERACALVHDSRILLCVGSTLEVHPVSQLPANAKHWKRTLAILTRGHTPFDPDADFKITDDLDAIPPRPAELVLR